MFLSPTAMSAALMVFALLSGGQATALPSASEQQILRVGEILRGRFILDRRLAGFDKPLRSEGTFTVIAGRGLIWHAEKPFESTTVITARGITVHTNGSETLRLSASRMPSLGHLYDILEEAVSGNVGSLKDDFSVTRSADPEGWHLVLTPRHGNASAISQIATLTITGGRFVEHVDIERTGGDVDNLSFVDQTEQLAPPTAEESALLGPPK